MFEKLNRAAKIDLSLGFILRNVDPDEYRYFYVHENNTFFEKSHFLCSKGDFVSVKDRVEKMDLVETCAQERANKKWRYALTTNVTIFCALLNNVPMGCLDAVIPEQLLRRSDVNCLVTNGYGETYKDYLCLFRPVAVHFYGSAELETNEAKFFNDFLHEAGHDAIIFRGVSMDHLVFVENAIKHNIFLYDIDIEDGDFVGEFARRSTEMYENNINLLRYNNHICYVDDINTFFKRFRYPNCKTLIRRAGNFHHHVKSCKDRIQHVYPKSVYTLRETLFDKLDGFGIRYEEDQKLFKNLAVCGFQSIYIPSNEKKTNTITWIGKHEPISVSISSNLLQETVFLCNQDPKTLIVSFVEALEELASKSKAEILQKFSSIENAIKTRVNSIFEKLNEKKNESTPVFEFQNIEEEEEIDMSTQFLQIPKNHFLELQQHFERYVSTLPVFGFNSGNNDLILIKSFYYPTSFTSAIFNQPLLKKLIISYPLNLVMYSFSIF